MGTKAKRFAGDEKIDLDFTYGVIDKCLLRAVNGENSLVLTSGGMVEHTVGRIAAYMEESGREIEVHLIRTDPSAYFPASPPVASHKVSVFLRACQQL